MTTPTPIPLTMGEVLRIPLLRRLWFAQLISTFGDFLALFAVISYLTFHLNANPHQITGLQIAYLLPIALLGIIAGVFVDRWPLKPLMVSSDLIRAGLCILLLFATELHSFYLILAAISILSSFFSPAQGVAIRSAVPLHGLRAAQALMQQVLFGMRIIGPPLAVAIYKALGPRWCYSADAISFLASATLIATVALNRTATPATPAETLATQLESATETSPEPAPVAPPKSTLASILPDMKAGLSFIFHHAGVLFVTVALAAAMFIIGCFGPLIAVYVRDNLHAQSGTYSLASLMIGIGMFAGINLLNTFGKRLANTLLVYCGLLGIAAGLLVLALLTHVWSTLLGTLITGIAVSAIVVPRQHPRPAGNAPRPARPRRLHQHEPHLLRPDSRPHPFRLPRRPHRHHPRLRSLHRPPHRSHPRRQTLHGAQTHPHTRLTSPSSTPTAPSSRAESSRLMKEHGPEGPQLRRHPERSAHSFIVSTESKDPESPHAAPRFESFSLRWSVAPSLPEPSQKPVKPPSLLKLLIPSNDGQTNPKIVGVFTPAAFVNWK